MVEKLDRENLPEEIKTREQFIKEFIENYKIETKNFKGKTHLMCWKINVGNLSEEETVGYINSCQSSLEDELKKVAWACFFIPTRNEPTTLTLIDLRSMKYVQI